MTVHSGHPDDANESDVERDPTGLVGVEVRLTREDLELVERAAREAGMSVSEFLVSSALDAAAPNPERYGLQIRLSARDSELLFAALDAEPRVNPALRRAAERSRERFGE